MNQAYFVIIAIFLSAFGTIYTYLSYRNKERMALIESGLDPASFKSKSSLLLTSGLLFLGIAAGVIIGFFFEKYLLLNYNPYNYRNYPQAYLTMVPLCVGVALIVAFLFNRKIEK